MIPMSHADFSSARVLRGLGTAPVPFFLRERWSGWHLTVMDQENTLRIWCP